MLNRDEFLDRVDEQSSWDVVVIGGGATGLGTAVDAAARGYRTLLLEQLDFAKGTSSRSTKLIHGGVRYLRQGNVHLVRESLHERGLLLRNAPQLVRPLQFLIPVQSRWEAAYFWAGLKAYDLLAGRYRIKASRYVNRREILRQMPTLSPAGLSGGVTYSDAQFDDARLAMALVQTLADLGGTPLNYCPVTKLLKESNRICGVVGTDSESGREFEIRAEVVINATGAFGDAVRRMDETDAPSDLILSQGIHIVLDKSFFPSDTALIVPETEDGRVLFFIPWYGSVLVGTTDTPITEAQLEPRPQKEELAYLLEYAARYLSEAPQRADIRSTFAGIRPLARSLDNKPTSQVSRDHAIHVSDSGLVTVNGGKWTTYRVMGKDAVDAAIAVTELEKRRSRTGSLQLAVPALTGDVAGRAGFVPQVIDETFVTRAARAEMARTVEDVLARRTRLLFCDARAAMEAADETAAILARELSKTSDWERQQVETFHKLAQSYLVE